MRLCAALTTDAATARDLIKPPQMGGSRVLNPKNLAEIFNRQLFAAIKTQRDIQRLSLWFFFFFSSLNSGRTNENGTGKKDDCEAAEREMK